MKQFKIFSVFAIVLFFFGAACTSFDRAELTSQETILDRDPFSYLDEVIGAQALSWVKNISLETKNRIGQGPRHQVLESEVRQIYLAPDRLPMGTLVGGFIYNFWQDKKSVRGVWRRKALAKYSDMNSKTKADDLTGWDILIDFDQLARSESKNWVFQGVNCLRPAMERCLVHLSVGGGDRAVIREFDILSKTFVEGGFSTHESKSSAEWLDRDHLMVAIDSGGDSVTQSGYPRNLKIWKRGQTLADLSRVSSVLSANADDLGVGAQSVISPGGVWHIAERMMSYLKSQKFLVDAKGRLNALPIPEDATIDTVVDGKLIVSLRSDWSTRDGLFKKGSLISIDANDFGRPPRLIYFPSAKEAVRGAFAGKSSLIISTLKNVRGQIHQASQDAGGKWTSTNISGENVADVSVVSIDAFADSAILSTQQFLLPTSVRLLENISATPKLQTIRRAPKRFDENGMESQQKFATSKDGTEIPYFLIFNKKFAGIKMPTILYGYGGFEISQTPHYLSTIGKTWLERGGAYAVANIRGGGEFGPSWHQAALKENRQRAYDDFIAVAEDLIETKVTDSEHLAIKGASNGGLLVSAVMVQRPELFKAVVCMVPLTDMLKYHHMLAGHSWMDEYGNPDDPTMRKVLSRYSPYHNLKQGVVYPKTLFLTSTKDDRVHPGHARRMAAKMISLGQKIEYYENTEGGHGAAANLEQAIEMEALSLTFLSEQLGLKIGGAK
jgi:prolyl oligopeptidase